MDKLGDCRFSSHNIHSRNRRSRAAFSWCNKKSMTLVRWNTCWQRHRCLRNNSLLVFRLVDPAGYSSWLELLEPLYHQILGMKVNPTSLPSLMNFFHLRPIQPVFLADALIGASTSILFHLQVLAIVTKGIFSLWTGKVLTIAKCRPTPTYF